MNYTSKRLIGSQVELTNLVTPRGQTQAFRFRIANNENKKGDSSTKTLDSFNVALKAIGDRFVEQTSLREFKEQPFTAGKHSSNGGKLT